MSEPERWKDIARAIIPLPQRTVLAIMTFIGVVIAYAMRVCLSITIVSIVYPKEESPTNTTNYECPFPSDYNTGSIIEDPLYSWSEQLIGNILSSFYIGYVLCHFPGGMLSDYWGGKPVLIGSVGLTSLFNIITPISIIYGGPYLLMVVRILMGAAQGCLFPSVNVLLAAWIPKDERAFYGAVVYSSSQIGAVFGTAFSGVLLHRLHSWSIVYYIFGAIGWAWCALYFIMCSNDPQHHSYISDEEKEMLEEQIGIIPRPPRIRDAPWCEMIKNTPVLVLVICNCGHDFGFFTMISYLPKYLSDVLHYDIQTNGFYSALPFVMMFVVSVLTGFLADLIIKLDLMSLVNNRKLFTTLSTFLPAIGMIVASYAGCDRTIVVTGFTVGLATMGFFYSSLRVNALDLSPNFAGLLMAYVNGVGAIMGILSPIIIGALTVDSTVMEYRVAFWITFMLMNSTCVIYIFFASGDIQPFNDYAPKPGPTE